MDILVPDEWLREYLDTKATPKQITEYLSLCGPSVNKTTGKGKKTIYEIEITTNRVDSMSIYGIAREVAAILPRFGIKAKLKDFNPQKIKAKKSLDFNIKNNSSLCKRILAVKIENVKIGPSPKWLRGRLKKVGQDPLNNVVDITNYVMWELGHPIHAFDYDLLKEKTIVVREADKGERLTTLDGEEYKMFGGEVVFDNGTGIIIDLPGIKGAQNSAVTKETKNVLLWIESIDPAKIRRTSIKHMIRTQAAVLNEKGVDPELGLTAILRAVELYKKITKATSTSKLIDIYEKPYKTKKVTLTKNFIDQRLGIKLAKSQIIKYLDPLGFKASWRSNSLDVLIPPFRVEDITIPEDIVEEVARIYGYHNFPSELMTGKIPDPLADSPFEFEEKIKNILKGFGGTEVYTFSLVSKESADITNALRLKNPLGSEKKYLRTSLVSSLTEAANSNAHEKGGFHLFEMANVYLPRRSNAKAGPKLPKEEITLAGIFSNTSFREAKGIIESLLLKLNINAKFAAQDSFNFLPSRRVKISSKASVLGQLGVLEEKGYLYYELDIEALRKVSSPVSSYKSPPKYPAQIEDITLKLPPRTKIGGVMDNISSDSLIAKVELTSIYKDANTFRIWYQHPTKTLTNKEVEKIRKKLLTKLKRKFGATLKD